MGCGTSKNSRVADLHQFDLAQDYHHKIINETALDNKFPSVKVGLKLLYLDDGHAWIAGEIIRIEYEGSNSIALFHFVNGEEKWLEIETNLSKLSPLELLNSYTIDNGIPLTDEQMQIVQYFFENGTLKRGIHTGVISNGIIRKTEFEKARQEELDQIKPLNDYNQSVSYFKQLMTDDNATLNSAESPPNSIAKSVKSAQSIKSAPVSLESKKIAPEVMQPAYVTPSKPTYAAVVARGPLHSANPRQPLPPSTTPTASIAPAMTTTPMSMSSIGPEASILTSATATSTAPLQKEEMIGKAVLMRGYVKSRKLRLKKQEIDALNTIIHFHDKAKNHDRDFPAWVYQSYGKVLAKYEQVLSHR